MTPMARSIRRMSVTIRGYLPPGIYFFVSNCHSDASVVTIMKMAGRMANQVGREREASHTETTTIVSAAINWFALPKMGQMCLNVLV